jgi:hypothetical protein
VVAARRFRLVLSRAKVDLQHEACSMSITDRITQLMEKLQGKAQFPDDLFDGQRTRFDLIITFLALLE